MLRGSTTYRMYDHFCASSIGTFTTQHMSRYHTSGKHPTHSPDYICVEHDARARFESTQRDPQGMGRGTCRPDVIWPVQPQSHLHGLACRIPGTVLCCCSKPGWTTQKAQPRSQSRPYPFHSCIVWVWHHLHHMSSPSTWIYECM